MSTDERLPVRRTAKLFIGGKFPRSESGRSYEVVAQDGRPLGYAAQASRKDLRDAVVAARAAQPGWAGMTAYNRGQILYRVAELMEGRREQFGAELADAGAADPDRGVDAAIDRVGLVRGLVRQGASGARRTNRSPARTSTSRSRSRPGVVGHRRAPQDQSLLGLISRPGSGDRRAATRSSPSRARRARCRRSRSGEVLATSDVPGGVVNLLTGYDA